MGVREGVANFFLGQSIGIDEINTLRHRLWRFVGVAYSRDKLTSLSLIVSEISAFILTNF